MSYIVNFLEKGGSVPLILHYQNERSSNVGCITYECPYNDGTAAQNCFGVTLDDTPAVELCEEYEPEKPANQQTLESTNTTELKTKIE